MTTEEVGAYMLLLCKSWREEPPASIPDNDLVLARWARLTPDRWQVCKPGVLAAFILGTDSRWHQKRLRREYDKLRVLRKQRSDASKKRWNKDLNASALHKHSIPSSFPFPSSIKPTEIETHARAQFDRFWAAYPNQLDRDDAYRAFLCLNPIDQQKAAESIPAWAKSDQWAERRFVPAPVNFIKKRRWEYTPKAKPKEESLSEQLKRLEKQHGVA